MLKTPFYDYEYGDLQFYYRIHVARQKADGEIPLAYDTFIKRLKKMTLYDAIYKPRAFEGKKWKSKTPIQDHQRRIAKLKEENVQLLTFEEMKKVEQKYLHPKQKKMPRYNMKPNRIQIPKPKKSLWNRFLSLFK